MFLCSFHGPMSVATALLTIRACLGFEFFCCFGALFLCVSFERFINRDDLPVQVYKHQVRHLCLHEAGFTWPFCPPQLMGTIPKTLKSLPRCCDLCMKYFLQKWWPSSTLAAAVAAPEVAAPPVSNPP